MIGQQVSHFRIVSTLGYGGMGVVYKAIDLKLDRPVALKFLPHGMTHDAEAKRRFIHEAKAASSLDHPGICAVYEIDETPTGDMFIAMAYYDGQTLRERLGGGRLEVQEAVDFAMQMASGLAAAHKKGVIHRDVKPDNVIITAEGQAKIVDFGVAKLAGESKITRTGMTPGTASYMSPEQARGEAIDGRSDVFSLCAVLYEMLAGRRAFEAEHEAAILYRVVNEAPDPIDRYRSGVPAALAGIVDRGLAKEPDQRQQSMQELLDDLTEIETGRSFAVRREGRRGSRRIQARALRKLIEGRRRMVILLVALGAAVAALVLWLPATPRFDDVILEGFVRAVDSTAVANAQITVDGHRFSTTSKDDGRFISLLEQAEMGRPITVRLYHPGFKSLSVDCVVDSSREHLDFWLEPR